MAWHTDVHEYAAWRFEKAASLVPAGARSAMAGGIARLALVVSIWFYRKAAVGLAPNSELVDLLRHGHSETGVPHGARRRYDAV